MRLDISYLKSKHMLFADKNKFPIESESAIKLFNIFLRAMKSHFSNYFSLREMCFMADQ